jgi:hypothetical protein
MVNERMGDQESSMSAQQLKRLTPRHDAILAFVMANPRIKRGEVASYFGVTEAWLSTIINSDIFQARLAERTDQVFCETLVPLKDKVEAIAHTALDNLAKVLEHDQTAKTNFATAEMALKMAGFNTKHTAPSGVVNNTQNNYIVSGERLAAARERMGVERKPLPLPLEALTVEGD